MASKRFGIFTVDGHLIEGGFFTRGYAEDALEADYACEPGAHVSEQAGAQEIAEDLPSRRLNLGGISDAPVYPEEIR